MPTDTAEKPAIETHPITPPTMRRMHGLLRNHGVTTDEAVHAYLTSLLGREVTSRKAITEAEGRLAITDCEAAAVAENPGGHPNLAAALIAVQSMLPKVPKAQTANIPGKNGGTGYRYSYADLGDVSDAVMPLLGRHGIAWTCLPRSTPSGGYELVGTLIHASGDEREGALPLFGRQAQDLGSSITYARRYLLGCMTGLVTDDDEDGALAAAARDRAQQPPPYQGPPTQQLLDRLTQLAISEGTTDEAMSAKWREAHGGLSFDALATLEPWHLWPLIQSIETYMAKRDAAQAVAATQQQGVEA